MSYVFKMPNIRCRYGLHPAKGIMAIQKLSISLLSLYYSYTKQSNYRIHVSQVIHAHSSCNYCSRLLTNINKLNELYYFIVKIPR